MQIFINFDEEENTEEEDVDAADERIRALLETSVDELELSVRSSNCLRNANIQTIGQLVAKSEEDIGKTRNFGKKSLDEIKTKLGERHLRLGLTDYAQLRAELSEAVTQSEEKGRADMAKIVDKEESKTLYRRKFE